MFFSRLLIRRPDGLLEWHQSILNNSKKRGFNGHLFRRQLSEYGTFQNLSKGKGRVKKKKKSDIYHLGWGVSKGHLSLSIFFVPNALKIISRHLSFFKYRGRGVP